MTKCIVCGIELDGRTVCKDCERVTGVRPMPPPRRRAMPCARCNHAHLIRVIPRELSVLAGRDENHAPDANVASYGPMFATYETNKRSIRYHFLKDDLLVTDPPDANEGFGVFEAYICRRCGFVDWYCQDPEAIPIGPTYMTENVDTTGAEPYR